MNHEFQYNPRAYTGNVDSYLRRAALRSEEARAQLGGYLDIAYGASPLMKCDIFPASIENAPVHVFVHGGYWRGRDKRDYSYLARLLHKQEVTAVIANYDLCPMVTLDVIVDEIVTLFSWVKENAGKYGGNPQAVIASGHSAGAHLVAMACSPNLIRHVPAGTISQGILISGLYELEPVLDVSVNKEVKLTKELAVRLSPLLNPPHSNLPLDIVVGGDESENWIAQSQAFYARLSEANTQHRLHRLEGHNHYSIMESLDSDDSYLSSLFAKINNKYR
ncbi:alpha/beta hydrolase [Halomonas alkalisoli]|uniref:alpha/beta hydrolase n=1 Tax=Halomonas alkalisoli TaxID=2907158 RepID=UPI001F4354E8|nr:alpha/beta hydrolase [Halomonas alkalisoli]MCE9681696.1 alpha/beta hydrolase [Halomonas alkalisoli]